MIFCYTLKIGFPPTPQKGSVDVKKRPNELNYRKDRLKIAAKSKKVSPLCLDEEHF